MADNLSSIIEAPSVTSFSTSPVNDKPSDKVAPVCPSIAVTDHLPKTKVKRKTIYKPRTTPINPTFSLNNKGFDPLLKIPTLKQQAVETYDKLLNYDNITKNTPFLSNTSTAYKSMPHDYLNNNVTTVTQPDNNLIKVVQPDNNLIKVVQPDERLKVVVQPDERLKVVVQPDEHLKVVVKPDERITAEVDILIDSPLNVNNDIIPTTIVNTSPVKDKLSAVQIQKPQIDNTDTPVSKTLEYMDSPVNKESMVTPIVYNKEIEVHKTNRKIPRYSEMTLEEQARHRATFTTRFGLLREKWKNYHIPDIKDNMSLEEIHEQYDVYVKNIHVHISKDKYKIYMVIMWLFIEFVCIKIGLNVSGYTMSQLKGMSKYDKLLIELGEKSNAAVNNEESVQWPVEMNIIYMALVNAVTFIIIRVLADYIGEGFANEIVNAMSSYLSETSSESVATGIAEVEGKGSNDNMLSMIANMGNMFLNSQKAKAAPADTIAKSPKFKPVYDDD